ncbi:MAG TPA: magnesium chelatase subunit D family protein [Anaerolineae bacterium]|nr:magnesium chelatase subunit D family protein [Anaerolineae bacterium]
MIPIFPFTAIVGQGPMKRGLILNAINPLIGGVLIRGERGTAKSTAARALAALLPAIEVVADCPYCCDPHRPEAMCDSCAERYRGGEKLPVASRAIRIIDLPVSATEDRVVGTLDIESAIKTGTKRFEPGVLATANRGMLYVDEVNLLDDHVVDVLLDSAAMGVNVVEREGISFSHPAQFILVGTMNPEEGELRPQLLDRFGLCVLISSISEPEARKEILVRRIQYEKDPLAFYEAWREEEQELARQIARARDLLYRVSYTEEDLSAIAQLTADMGVDGHRGDLVILKASVAHAAFEGRGAISQRDILLAAELALPHRLKRQPLQHSEARMEQLREQLRGLEAGVAERDATLVQEAQADGKKKDLSSDELESEDNLSVPQSVPRQQGTEEGSASFSRRGTPIPVGDPLRIPRLSTPLDRLSRRSSGRRSLTRTNHKRGRYVSSRPMDGRIEDIAFDATLRQAAPHQVERERSDVALAIETDDLRRKVRVSRTANLVLFVVDASWSMAAAERMVATKGAILSLLQDAYQRRDRVGLVVFRQNGAELLLPPTSSVKLAEKLLEGITVGGKTPLSSGLHMSYQVFTREMRRNPSVLPLMILLTDGAGNVSMTEMTPHEEGCKMAELIKRSDIRSVVINTEHKSFDRGLAQELAFHLGAECYTLEELGAEELYKTVRGELQC